MKLSEREHELAKAYLEMPESREGCPLCIVRCYIKELAELVLQGDSAAYKQLFVNKVYARFSDTCAGEEAGELADKFLGMR